jgi:hypothetical protein
VGSLLCLVRTVVDINGQSKSAIKLVKIVDGADGCTIGFVPRVQSRLPKVVDCVDRLADDQELFSSSKCSYKRENTSKIEGWLVQCFKTISQKRNEV